MKKLNTNLKEIGERPKNVCSIETVYNFPEDAYNLYIVICNQVPRCESINIGTINCAQLMKNEEIVIDWNSKSIIDKLNGKT